MTLFLALATYDWIGFSLVAFIWASWLIQRRTRRRIVRIVSDLVSSLGFVAFGLAIGGTFGTVIAAIFAFGFVWAVITHFIWRPKYMRDADAAYYRD